MRENDLYRQRFQQHTERLALVGLEKGELFVLKKTVGFALIKADCVALIKADCIVLIKTGFFAFKKAFWFALRKADLSFFEREAACIEERMLRLESAGHQCRS